MQMYILRKTRVIISIVYLDAKEITQIIQIGRIDQNLSCNAFIDIFERRISAISSFEIQ